MMRLLFLVVMLVGAAVGYGYPYAMGRLAGHEIGTWKVQDVAAGFRPVDATLSASDAPVRVVFDVVAVAPPSPVAGQSALTLTVASGGRTLLAETLDLADAEVREDSPQTPQKIYRLEASSLRDIADGIYTFTVGPGDAEGLEVIAVDLRLLGGAPTYDQRAQPIGLSIMALGFIGLAISLRMGRNRKSGSVPTPPEAPRWGRGDAPDA